MGPFGSLWMDLGQARSCQKADFCASSLSSVEALAPPPNNLVSLIGPAFFLGGKAPAAVTFCPLFACGEDVRMLQIQKFLLVRADGDEVNLGELLKRRASSCN